MALLSPGQIFAERYRIERYLAKGGFGAVYVAEQLATELRVAIKILWPNVLQSADLVEKFKLEARIAGRVNSDHIVRVVDAGFDAATSGPFLVMELLDGNDLQTVVERTGPIAPERVALYLRQAASALDKAHGFRDRQGAPTPIIHRDLKPENLFLTFREDRTPHVKVLDFGIAKVLSSATKVSQQIKGTPLYMAFEQAGGGPISPATDVWALGLIAFFLLTGKSYWRAANLEGSSLTQLFGELLAHPIVPPSQRVAEMGWPPRFPPAFDAWFLRCVDRDQRSRFASAGEAATALHAALGFDVAALGPVSLPSAGLPSAPAGGPASIPGRAESGGMAQSGAPSLGPGSASYPGATGGGSAARSIPPSRPLTSTSAVALASDSRAIPGRRSLVAPVLGAGVVLGLALGGAAWWARSSASARVAAPSSAASAAPEPAPPPTAPAPLVAPSAPLEPAAAEPAASTPSARPGKAPPRPSGQAKAAPAPLPTTQPTTAPTARPTNVYGER